MRPLHYSHFANWMSVNVNRLSTTVNPAISVTIPQPDMRVIGNKPIHHRKDNNGLKGLKLEQTVIVQFIIKIHYRLG